MYGRGIWGIGLFNADLAALSAFSLPGMLTWLGSQQNIILNELIERLWYFNKILRVIGCSSFLLAMELRIDKESEKVGNIYVVVC